MAVGLVLALLAALLGALFDFERGAGWLLLIGVLLMFASLVRWLWLVMP